jgi:hypothetical protein
MRNASNSLVGVPEGNNSLTDPGVDSRVILKWIVNTWGVRMWTGFSYSVCS